MKSAKKARGKRAPREPVQAVEDTARERRQKAIADARDRIAQVAESTSAALPLTPDGVRFLLGGLMSFLTPPSAKVTIRMEDGRDVPLDGQQIRDVGTQLIQQSALQTMIKGVLKTPQEKAEAAAAAAAAAALCSCGHPKSDHIRTGQLGLGSRCLGKLTTDATPWQQPLDPPRECTCPWYIATKSAPAPSAP
jgi:hypothetical protein